ncbi:hypothetical protein B0O99DRAFT_604560 [Bisporella sp. PMI_857]|nr:hypothetical protein B0O99DRAFT_604560 [Bisporella sp. PMI_857]
MPAVVEGRFCSDAAGPSCCLPCPQAEWLYPDNFKTMTKSANWINVIGLTCCVFLILSYAALPVSKTHRHYLSICLVLSVMVMQLAFVVPLGAKPNQCYNDITPNDMKTSGACAVSGSFILAGGWCGVMWVFLRALALHLQICWQYVLGNTFMYGAFAAGWGVPAIALTLALVFSGVSFRFGESCHINHKNSLADFWIPLLIFAGVTVIIQFATFGYCIKVYLQSLSDDSSTTNSSGLPSYSGSVRATLSPRQAYRRVRRVLELQWRGIVIVIIIIADVIFFAVVFVFLDDIEASLLKDPLKGKFWLVCLIEKNGDKNQCLDLAAPLVINESTVMAVLLLLSINGIWLLLLLGRRSMFTGWVELVRGKIKPNHEFVSADVGRFKDPVTPLSPAVQQPLKSTLKSGRETPDYFGREARYTSPSRSFSAPKPPTMVGWDDTRSHAMPGRSPSPYKMDPLSMNKI